MLKSKIYGVALCVAAFGMSSGSALAADALSIGIVESISGPAAAYGDAHHKGTQLAFEEINKAGGFNGKPIEFHVEDDRSDPAAGINAAKKLITQRKVDAIVGSSASLVTIAFSKENEKYKVPLMNGMAGSPTVTEQGYKYTWRINMTDRLMDEKIAEHFFTKYGKKKFAFLVENSEYGKPPTKAAAEKLKSLGAEVTTYEEYNRGETDFKAQLSKIKDTNPEVIFVHGYYTEGSIIARQIKELGIDVQLIVNQGQGVPKFMELAGDAAEGVVFPTTWLPGLDHARSKHFEEAFEAKYNAEPDAFAAGTYDAVYVVLEAAKLGGGNSPAQIQAGFGKMKGFDSLLGAIDFDEKNQNNGQVRLATFSGGKIIPLK
ncbi:ABC transporter substrate-binding protein [Alcaligenaceae bacterium CGII-47]|nr:ABC transporter substrate-binding protein [Alcaligenaceae bacterium CGII-47]